MTEPFKFQRYSRLFRSSVNFFRRNHSI